TEPTKCIPKLVDVVSSKCRHCRNTRWATHRRSHRSQVVTCTTHTSVGKVLNGLLKVEHQINLTPNVSSRQPATHLSSSDILILNRHAVEFIVLSLKTSDHLTGIFQRPIDRKSRRLNSSHV